MSYAKGKNFNVVFLPLRYSAGDTYRGSGLVINKTVKPALIYFVNGLEGYTSNYEEENKI